MYVLIEVNNKLLYSESEDKGKGGRKSKMLYFGHGLAGSGIVGVRLLCSHLFVLLMIILL